MVVAAGIGLSEGIVGEKRRPCEDMIAQPKRFKGDGVVRDLRKVAGLVLMLAAMGKMRGGRAPTEAEKEIMAEARNGLIRVCEGFPPKDVFGRDSFGGVMEDLGLNRLEERSGVQPRKISIAQKLLDSKRKMEQADDFSFSFIPFSTQHHQGNSGALYNLPICKMGSSAPLPYQLPTSEVKPVVSSVLQSSHSVSVAWRGIDPNLRTEGRSKGLSHALQAKAHYSVNPSARTTSTCLMQPQPISSSKTGSDNKVLGTMSLKAQGTTGKSGMTTQVTSRNINAQAGIIPPSQVANNGQASMGTTHAEIGSIAQRLLQPLVSEHCIWIPPSQEYMNKAVACQICMATVTEIHSILICDACDKGYHLKCLQATNQKEVTSGEWHCGQCLSWSNGKPFPPTYGCVMRNMDMSELSSNSTAFPSTLRKRVGALDEKAGQPKVTINGKTQIQNVPANAVGNNGIISTGSETDDKVSCRKWANKADKTYHEETFKTLLNGQDGNTRMLNGEANTVKTSLENHNRTTDSKESPGNMSLNHTSATFKDKNLVPNNSSDIVSDSGPLEQGRSSDCLHSIEWIGEPLQVLDEKIYYVSCSINGHVYKVMDHAVIHVDNGKLTPSKLHAMWEDIRTTKKWITVNRCYFPGDLPEGVGHPCSLSSDEVYESTCSITVKANFIEGPCKVLPAGKFAEETQKRSHLVVGSPPLYLCRWIYDESKGLFRDIFC